MELLSGKIKICYPKSKLSKLAKLKGSVTNEHKIYSMDNKEYALGTIEYEAEDHDEIWPEGEVRTKRYVVKDTNIILQIKGEEVIFRPIKEREKKVLEKRYKEYHEG